MYRGTLVYPFELQAGKTTVVYVRSHAYSHQWFSLITTPIFLLLFMMAIFETHECFRTEHRVLQGMLALLVVTFVYGLFDIATALKPASSLGALMMVVTFSVSRCRL